MTLPYIQAVRSWKLRYDRTRQTIFFQMAKYLGFNGLEISDGTIEMSRSLRSELICRGLNEGFMVITEYGKKRLGFIY